MLLRTKIIICSATILLLGPGCSRTSNADLAAVAAARARAIQKLAELSVPHTATLGRTISLATPNGWSAVANGADVDKSIVFDIEPADKSAEFMIRTDAPSDDGVGFIQTGTEAYRKADPFTTYTIRTFAKDAKMWEQLGFKGINDNPRMLMIKFVGTASSGGAFELRGIYNYDTSVVKDPVAAVKKLIDGITLQFVGLQPAAQ